MKKILYIATVLIVTNFLFWKKIEAFLGFQVFEMVQAIFIFLLCLYIFYSNKRIFISFFLLCCSINNLMDEVFGTWDRLYISEIILLIIIPIVWKFYNIKYARQN